VAGALSLEEKEKKTKKEEKKKDDLADRPFVVRRML